MRKLFYYYCIIIALASNSLNAARIHTTELPKVGGPGPLFAFGHNIVPKGVGVIGGSVFQTQASRETLTFSRQIALYGLTNRCSILVSIPEVQRTFRDLRSSGLSDLGLQLEYAYYEHRTHDHLTRATILGQLFLPTSNFHKELLLGRGTVTPFIGTTFSNLSPRWFTYGATGYLIPTHRKHIHYGGTLLYQLGIGTTIISDQRIWLGFLAELSGFYLQQDTINDVVNKNSGGNTIWAGPVVRMVWKGLLAQVGFQQVASQNLRGTQEKRQFRMGFSVAYGIKFK